MSKKTLGISIALFGVIIFFSNLENAWIVSAVLLGFGSGFFFGKIKLVKYNVYKKIPANFSNRN